MEKERCEETPLLGDEQEETEGKNPRGKGKVNREASSFLGWGLRRVFRSTERPGQKKRVRPTGKKNATGVPARAGRDLFAGQTQSDA